MGKPIICGLCGEKIKDNEKYTEAYGYDIGNNIVHERCDFIAQNLWYYIDPEDIINPENFREGLSNFCHDFICPECKTKDTCDKSYCMHKIDTVLNKYKLRCYYDGIHYYKLEPKDKDVIDDKMFSMSDIKKLISLHNDPAWSSFSIPDLFSLFYRAKSTVVRCKECIYYKDKMCTVHKSDKNNVSVSSVGEYYVKENGYCDLGKRESDMVWTVI